MYFRYIQIKKMSVITLSSDYGNKDYFISSIKGYLCSNLESVKVIDISHNITPFHLGECAYILRNAYPHFPDKTIHIIGLDSEIKGEKKHIIAKVENQYFIGTDSGLFSLLFQNKKIEKIIQVEFKNDINDSTFPMMNVFAKIACKIINGQKIETFGIEIKSFLYNKENKPIVNTDEIKKQRTIISEVIYIDRFGNAITNISKDFFEEKIGKKPFTILLRRNQTIKIISEKYSDVAEGNILAIFNSAQLLEISVMRRNTSEIGANRLLGIEEKDSILIEF